MTGKTERYGRILIVDDEEPVARLLQRWLADEGYAAEVAGGFEEARARLEQENFDLVTLDIMMPEVGGMQVLEWIRERYPDVGIIMATAIGKVDSVLEAMRGGAMGYLIKPFNLELVTEEIGLAMERQRLVAENRAYRLELEQKVEERTRQLRQKVRELDGRDRLVHFQMEVHHLEEAHSEVLEVVAKVLEVRKAVLYRSGEDGGLEPVMGLGLSVPGRLERGEEWEKGLAEEALAARKLQQGEGERVAVPMTFSVVSWG